MTDKELYDLTMRIRSAYRPDDRAILGLLDAGVLAELLDELATLRRTNSKPHNNPSILAMAERYLSGENDGVYLAFQVWKNPELGRHDLMVMAQSDFIGAAQTKWTTRVDLNRIGEIPREIAEGIVSEAVHLAVTKVLPVVGK